MIDTLVQDVRHALRSLAKSPGFTLAAVLTLGLGIGANTAIFSLVKSALLRSLPYGDPARLVHLWDTNPNGGLHESSYPDYLDWRAENGVFDEIGGYVAGITGTLSVADSVEPVRLGRATATFFPALGVAPRLGRGFTPEEERRESEPAAIISDALFASRFGSDTSLIGKTIVVNGRPRHLVGVLPKGFQFAPHGGADVWLAARPSTAEGSRRNYWWLNVVARLKPGVTLETAAAAMKARSAQLEHAYPESNSGLSVLLVPLRDQIIGPIRPILLALMTAVGFVLLIAGTNVTNLLLVRSVARRQELAIRQALGAGRRRLVQSALVESVFLGILGGSAGLLFARLAVPLLLRGIPENQRAFMPYLDGLSLDAGVLAFAFAISVVAGILFGLGSALTTSKSSLVDDLQRGTVGRADARRRGALVIAEMALAVVLLAGAGLMVRSTLALLRSDPGFEKEGLLTATVSVPSREAGKDRLLSFHNRVLETLRAVPGVTAASSIDIIPLGGQGGTVRFDIEGVPPSPPERPNEVNSRTTSPNYFRDMRVPLRAGRPFGPQDTEMSPLVLIVNESFAKRYFAGSAAVGRRIRFTFDAAQPFREIVGVVGDEKVQDIATPPGPVLYAVFAQDPSSTFRVVVRAATNPGALEKPIREALRALDRDIFVAEVLPMTRVISESPQFFSRRYPAFVLGAFAGMALFLALLGIHGVMAYSVAQRRREIGIRVAIGAEPRDVVRLVLGEGLVLAARGLVLGLVAALLLTQVLRSLLFGVRPTDPFTFVSIAFLFLGAAAVACWLPARRAAGIHPAIALRSE